MLYVFGGASARAQDAAGECALLLDTLDLALQSAEQHLQQLQQVQQQQDQQQHSLEQQSQQQQDPELHQKQQQNLVQDTEQHQPCAPQSQDKDKDMEHQPMHVCLVQQQALECRTTADPEQVQEQLTTQHATCHHQPWEQNPNSDPVQEQSTKAQSLQQHMSQEQQSFVQAGRQAETGMRGLLPHHRTLPEQTVCENPVEQWTAQGQSVPGTADEQSLQGLKIQQEPLCGQAMAEPPAELLGDLAEVVLWGLQTLRAIATAPSSSLQPECARMMTEYVLQRFVQFSSSWPLNIGKLAVQVTASVT